MEPVVPFSQMALVDLLDDFASSDPVPGGGSAAALGAALGVSLLLMVAGNTRTRTGAPEEGADLAEAAARLRPLRDSLVELIDRDSDAYTEVLTAMRLPKGTDAEKAARATAIQETLRGATDTPLDTLRLCQQALRGAVVVATAGARSAATDAAVGVELLLAAARGAARNVDVNLAALKDDSYITNTRAERQELEAECVADAEKARQGAAQAG